mmetsp:Transcript_112002/g.281900  ORF Transcript_112002/g.281900 Transcript_112002/m.281900 type:complete len:236 (-) Transcript_112002:730-1437(-)
MTQLPMRERFAGLTKPPEVCKAAKISAEPLATATTCGRDAKFRRAASRPIPAASASTFSSICGPLSAIVAAPFKDLRAFFAAGTGVVASAAKGFALGVASGDETAAPFPAFRFTGVCCAAPFAASDFAARFAVKFSLLTRAASAASAALRRSSCSRSAFWISAYSGVASQTRCFCWKTPCSFQCASWKGPFSSEEAAFHITASLALRSRLVAASPEAATACSALCRTAGSWQNKA